MRDVLDRPLLSWHLLMAVFVLLLGLGLAMVLSSSAVTAFRTRADAFAVFSNQAVYAAVGLLGFGVAMAVPVRWVRRSAFPAMLVSIALLAAVLVPGVGAQYNGARSWLVLGSLSVQPSELAKLALLLWMGQVLAARGRLPRSPRMLLMPVLPVFALMVVLIMLQPDPGHHGRADASCSWRCCSSPARRGGCSPAWPRAGLAGFFYLAMSAEYRLARLLSFIDPEAPPGVPTSCCRACTGWATAAGSGSGSASRGRSGATCRTPTRTSSSRSRRGTGADRRRHPVLLLFALLAYTGMRIARRNVDPFVKIVASAGTVWLVGQAAINIGYVVGLLPVTGIPLPMISSGGTSLLITMVVFGLLANFAVANPPRPPRCSRGGGRLARFLGMRPDPVKRPQPPGAPAFGHRRGTRR